MIKTALGKSVAVYEDYAIVGEPGSNNGTGNVQMYQYNGFDWNRLELSIGTSDGADSGRGTAVSIWGEKAAVGIPGYRNKGGLIFLEKSNVGWREKPGSFVLAPDDTLSQNFGAAVAMDGQRLIVGDPDRIVNGVARGAAYIYECSSSNWTHVSTLTTSVDQGDLQFWQNRGH